MFKSSRIWIAVIALATVAAIAAPTATAADRLKVVVPEPFEVNGAIYDSGTLTVREIGQLSPVATLNKVCVDGSCLSFVFTEAGVEDARSARDELIFTRAPEGHLVLDAVAWSGEPVRGMLVDRVPVADRGLMAVNAR